MLTIIISFEVNWSIQITFNKIINQLDTLLDTTSYFSQKFSLKMFRAYENLKYW